MYNHYVYVIRVNIIRCVKLAALDRTKYMEKGNKKDNRDS